MSDALLCAHRLVRPRASSTNADAVTILREESAAETGGVIHCFSGDRAQAKSVLDLGFDMSFSGVVTFKNADELRAVARAVPADRFLVETDAPFLAPLPYRGKRNEPAYVVHTAAAVAEARGQALEEIAAVTRANTERRFRLKPEPWAYGRSSLPAFRWRAIRCRLIPLRVVVLFRAGVRGAHGGGRRGPRTGPVPLLSQPVIAHPAVTQPSRTDCLPLSGRRRTATGRSVRPSSRPRFDPAAG